MDALIISMIVVGAAILVGLLVWRGYVARQRRTLESEPIDQLRAGGDPHADPNAAAQRAGGNSAWMRPTGGGPL